MSAAHGGQVLLSQAVADRLAGRLPPSVVLRDLGAVRLRDLGSAEQFYQLVHPQLRTEFPALRSMASTPNNLAQQLNSFVGRDREMEQVRQLLANSRLLTLLGMGGLGKSRLSMQVAADRARRLSGRRLVRRAGAACRPASGAAGRRLGAGGQGRAGRHACWTR